MQKSILKLSLLLVLAMTVASCASTKTREERNRFNESLYQQAVDAVYRGQFVLEANRLTFRRGGMANVMSNTNFVSLENGRVTIQTSSNRGWPGRNNLGGVTYDARPSTIRTNTDRHGNLHVTIHAQGAIFSGRISMTIFAGSNTAFATVKPTFRGQSITFHGVVVPAETSRVFRGRAI